LSYEGGGHVSFGESGNNDDEMDVWRYAAEE